MKRIRGQLLEEVLALVITNAPEGVRTIEVARALYTSPENVEQALRRLTNAGLVEHYARGMWNTKPIQPHEEARYRANPSL